MRIGGYRGGGFQGLSFSFREGPPINIKHTIPYFCTVSRIFIIIVYSYIHDHISVPSTLLPYYYYYLPIYYLR
jgi:hypothetical protein